jgi:NADPH:quinone reductase
MAPVRAVLMRAFGPPEVLGVEDVPDPVPGPGELRIAVVGAGTNPVDLGNRLDGTWAGITVPAVLGYDVAGVVDAVGPGGPPEMLGRRVMAMTPFPRGGGGYAEYAVVRADLVAEVPDGVTLLEAAAVPLAAGTAHDMLSRLGLLPGDSLLVVGASGGVGTFLVQVASAAGLRVTAVGGARSRDLLGRLGAASFVDYAQGPITGAVLDANGGPVDAVADLVGGSVLDQAIAAVRPHGRIAAVAYPLTLALEPLFDANLTMHCVLIEDSPVRIRQLAAALEARTIRPVVAEVFPLERAADAHRRLEPGHSGGKIVLEVRPEPGP